LRSSLPRWRYGLPRIPRMEQRHRRRLCR